MPSQEALGLIETRGLVAAIEAADAALKASQVRLAGIRKTVPALMTVQIIGETAAVRAAVDAGRAAAERIGTVVSTHVIPRPDPAVSNMEQGGKPSKAAAPPPRRKQSAPGKPSTPPRVSPATRATPSKPPSNLESMTVRELRALARSTAGLSIQGREIARATKAELLRALGR